MSGEEKGNWKQTAYAYGPMAMLVIANGGAVHCQSRSARKKERRKAKSKGIMVRFEGGGSEGVCGIAESEKGT